MSSIKVRVGPIGADFSSVAVPSIPLEVIDTDGAVLTRTTASMGKEQVVELPTGTTGTVFVRTRLPSGERQTSRVDLDHRDNAPIEMFQKYASPNEWLAWSRPQIQLGKLTTLTVALQNFGNVWARLWQHAAGAWMTIPMVPKRLEQETYAAQFEVELNKAGYLLQIGGDTLPWRFVALPGGGTVRILMTPNTSDDPRADPLRVAISRFNPTEEMLLTYLLHDRIQDAETLASAPRLAEQLLYGKYDNPVSACIGAYFMLRTSKLRRRIDWARNLYRDFEWLPDGAIIYANELFHDEKPNVLEIDRILDDAVGRGVPIFREGIRLLNNACQIMASGENQTLHSEARRKRVERLLVAEAWMGPYSGFYGRRPDAPVPVRYVGLPGSRKRIDPYDGRLLRTALKKDMEDGQGGDQDGLRADNAASQGRQISIEAIDARLGLSRAGSTGKGVRRAAKSDREDENVFFVVRAK